MNMYFPEVFPSCAPARSALIQFLCVPWEGAREKGIKDPSTNLDLVCPRSSLAACLKDLVVLLAGIEAFALFPIRHQLGAL
ncbi:hypothetical protein HPP92_010282 [Vanilla planifolia]|uniref:Uncharacterized protein n=1 Tax=Vanilla planifolia TaxID=51239 RepID=A0A835V2C2_VANPL|nr:hypothetical protein HPP92_010282 [Vanilla planifolia]